MAIGNAVQRGQFVYAMDASGRQLFVQPGELHGFTGSTVNVRRGRFVYTYNEQGRQTAVTPG
ncbi:MAG: hypothetical protein M3Q08_02155 [Pseudomonadota bacterium]|nr:hypothetical protein [Pseudomonadota bacterium]